MDSACFDPDNCPVERTLSVIGGRWKPLILFHLRQGRQRFNALRRLIPKVTQRMLTQHLRELEDDGIVSRTVHPVIPPHVDYALTALGRTLMPVMDAMAAWGNRQIGQRSAEMVSASTDYAAPPFMTHPMP